MRERKKSEETLVELDRFLTDRQLAVLILEDHDETRANLTRMLQTVSGAQTRRWAVTAVATLEEARGAVGERLFDLQILDRMVPFAPGERPNADSLSFVSWQRSENIQTPIVILTSKNELAHRMQGWDSHADHYIGKPFDRQELKAIVDNIFWRQEQARTLVRGKLKINFAGNGSMSYAGREIPLRPRELQILAYLAIKDPQPVSREDLLEHVWRFPRDPKTQKVNDPGTGVVDVRISALRNEGLKGHGLPPDIVASVPGGWRLNASILQKGWGAP